MGSPFPWYSAKNWTASASRPLAMSQRGDSGSKKTQAMTMTQANAWRAKGILHEESFWMKLHPYVTAAAGIEPPNQPQL